MISQARMDALFVVEAIDVAGNGSVELSIAREAAPMRELGLQGMKEAFHMSVVLAVARAVHAGDDAVGLEIVLVAVGRVLDATIGVEEQSGFGSASEIARLSARKVTSVVRLRASVQPMMRRENRSITVAR